jgi:hypothetical protein
MLGSDNLARVLMPDDRKELPGCGIGVFKIKWLEVQWPIRFPRQIE